MAKMIPSFFKDETPPGERQVFTLLSEGPSDWVILHSLDVAPWNNSLRTEIDFLVIMPRVGLLCIEVKSHASISFDGACWSPGTIKYSPFKQAIDASKTLHRRLSGLSSKFKKIPIVHVCIFPRASFLVGPNLSVNTWELIDHGTFIRYPNGMSLCVDLEKRATKSITIDPSLSKLSAALSREEVEEIVSYCQPVQKFIPARSAEILACEIEADKILRAQQKPLLNFVEVNDRILILGPAGTGKTFMALEIARRKSNRGKRVALICFNKLIGDWLRRSVQNSVLKGPTLFAGSVYQFLIELTGIKAPNSPAFEYWDGEFLDQIEELLTSEEFSARSQFDVLVIDEIQDILVKERLWEVLLSFLIGGKNGVYILSGDVESQAIYSGHKLKRLLDELNEKANVSKWVLTENCRNYRVVGSAALSLSGIGNDLYTEYLRGNGDQDKFDILFYSDNDAQTIRLVNIIKYFRSKGFKNEDIVLLSFKTLQNSIAKRLSITEFPVSDIYGVKGKIFATSIHAFKGMESKIVVVTDVEVKLNKLSRDMFYVGVTRATEAVRVLCDERSKESIIQWLREGAA